MGVSLLLGGETTKNQLKVLPTHEACYDDNMAEREAVNFYNVKE